MDQPEPGPPDPLAGATLGEQVDHLEKDVNTLGDHVDNLERNVDKFKKNSTSPTALPAHMVTFLFNSLAGHDVDILEESSNIHYVESFNDNVQELQPSQLASPLSSTSSAPLPPPAPRSSGQVATSLCATPWGATRCRAESHLSKESLQSRPAVP